MFSLLQPSVRLTGRLHVSPETKFKIDMVSYYFNKEKNELCMQYPSCPYETRVDCISLTEVFGCPPLFLPKEKITDRNCVSTLRNIRKRAFCFQAGEQL